jgi:hypothetical protein
MRILTVALISSTLLFGTVGVTQTDAAVNQTVSVNQTSVKLAKVKNRRSGKKTNRYRNCRILNLGYVVRYVCL